MAEKHTPVEVRLPPKPGSANLVPVATEPVFHCVLLIAKQEVQLVDADPGQVLDGGIPGSGACPGLRQPRKRLVSFRVSRGTREKANVDLGNHLVVVGNPRYFPKGRRR